MDKQLQKRIIYTVAYFGAMNYPLTTFELWRYCIGQTDSQEIEFEEILAALGSKEVRKIVKIQKGFVVLSGDKDFVEARLQNHKVSVASIKKIKRWSYIFRLIPYVRGVFVTGTLSMKNARTKSDWDILLVQKKDRIWIGRLIVGALLQLFGKRRHGLKISKRFCLNHYVTEEGLTLEEHSTYCAYFTTFSFPILGKEVHKEFLKKNEKWVRESYPNYENDALTVADSTKLPSCPTAFQLIVEKILEVSFVASAVNKLAKKVMIKKIENNPKTHLEGSDVRYGDKALVFLPNPHRHKILKLTEERLTKAIS